MLGLIVALAFVLSMNVAICMIIRYGSVTLITPLGEGPLELGLGCFAAFILLWLIYRMIYRGGRR